jgi:acetyl esterase
MPRSEIAGLLEMIGSAPEPHSIADLRATFEMSIPFINANPPPVAHVEAGIVVADGVRADVIIPPGPPPFPALVYLHGGGWSIGSPATHHKLTRELCERSGALVVSVDYRLSPEHPFPTPLEDCVTAARWARANVARYGGDAERIAIGGDSAGANLSAAVINQLRGEIAFRGALLIYGAFDLVASRRDYDRWAPVEDPVLPKRSMDLMIAAYLSGGVSRNDPRVSPLHADLRHFPPAHLVCGTWDPLLGESLAFERALAAVGRRATLERYDEMPHAFLQLPATESEHALASASAFLREVLA